MSFSFVTRSLRDKDLAVGIFLPRLMLEYSVYIISTISYYAVKCALEIPFIHYSFIAG